MLTIYAEAGERIDCFTVRVLSELKESYLHQCYAEHNGVRIMVYKQSYSLDIMEKFFLKRNAKVID